jgi:pilus assembly protein TadC
MNSIYAVLKLGGSLAKAGEALSKIKNESRLSTESVHFFLEIYVIFLYSVFVCKFVCCYVTYVFIFPACFICSCPAANQ